MRTYLIRHARQLRVNNIYTIIMDYFTIRVQNEIRALKTNIYHKNQEYIIKIK